MARNDKFDAQRFHVEHTLWRSEVTFVGQETEIFTRLLKTMEMLSTDVEPAENFRETLRRFEHQFHHFKQIVEQILAEIRDREGLMANIMRENTKHFNDELRESQAYLREKMALFYDDYHKLKTEFRFFIAKDAEKHANMNGTLRGAEE